MNKQLDDAIATAIVHTIDRLTEFFVKASAAKLVWCDEYAELLQLDNMIRRFWNEHGFSDELMEKRNLMDCAWDLLQCNFCYNRPAEVTCNDDIEREFGRLLQEFLSRYSASFRDLKLPVLDRLRAADLTHPFEFHLSMEAACGLFSEDFRRLSTPSDGHPRTIPQNVAQTLVQLLRRYPIFLNPAARFFFFRPADVGINFEGTALAFGASYDVSSEDFIAALEDYKFHFLMTRRYFAPNEIISRDDLDWKIMDQLAKAYVGKETRSNKYVSQKNSIAVTICAMYVWELVHGQQKEVTEAINQVADTFGDLEANSRRKKVRDRYRAIDQIISQTAEGYRAESVVFG